PRSSRRSPSCWSRPMDRGRTPSAASTTTVSMTSSQPPPRATSTIARPASTPARTRFSATSFPRWPSGSDGGQDTMDFTLNEEEQLLADSVNRLIDKAYDFETRKAITKSETGFEPRFWAALAELGLIALPLPEAHGGFGAG